MAKPSRKFRSAGEASGSASAWLLNSTVIVPASIRFSSSCKSSWLVKDFDSKVGILIKVSVLISGTFLKVAIRLRRASFMLNNSFGEDYLTITLGEVLGGDKLTTA